VGICCIIYNIIQLREALVLLKAIIDKDRLTEHAINEADSEKLTAMVEYVSQNIKLYNGEKDIDILRLLKKRCYDKELEVEAIKMCRAVGMYYFNSNNMMFARDKLRLAINKAEEIGRKDLVAAYSSELGLVFFYEHQHVLAEVEYKYVEKLLTDIPDLDKHILFLHYYRYGILLNASPLNKYERAQEALEKALSYAEEKVYTGLTLMNIGINYKRQSNFKKALDYYDKALITFDKNDRFSKSLVYNNLAELYKTTGGHGIALRYIKKAFDYLDNKDITIFFECFTTYTEIEVLLGEPEKALDKFMEMFYHIDDITVYKSYIIENIDSLTIAGAKSVKMLKKLEAVVDTLVKYTAADNSEYKQELERCLENIRTYIGYK